MSQDGANSFQSSRTHPYISNHQQVFVDEYCVDFNAARAGRKLDVHYKTVKIWMNDINVQRYIDIVLEKRRLENEVLVKATLEELTGIMVSDIKDIVGWSDGVLTLRNIEDIKNTKVIKSIENTRNGIKVTLHDKVRAIELMMQGLGMIRKAKAIEDDDKKAPQDTESTAESLLAALTRANEERLSLPKLTGGLVEIDQSKVKTDD